MLGLPVPGPLVDPKDAIDRFIGASAVMHVDQLGRTDGPDRGMLPALPPAGLVGMDHRTRPNILLELLVGWLSGCCHPLEQANDATMTDGEPIVSLQPFLDQSPGETLDGGHGRDCRQQAWTEPAPSDSPRLPTDRWRQHPLPTAGIHSLRSGRRMIRCSVISNGATTGRSITWIRRWIQPSVRWSPQRGHCSAA